MQSVVPTVIMYFHYCACVVQFVHNLLTDVNRCIKKRYDLLTRFHLKAKLSKTIRENESRLSELSTEVAEKLAQIEHMLVLEADMEVRSFFLII